MEARDFRCDPEPHEILDEEQHGHDTGYGGCSPARSRRELVNCAGRDRGDSDQD